MRGEKTAVLVLTSMVRICHSSGDLNRKCYYLMHESKLKNQNMMFPNEIGIVLLRGNHYSEHQSILCVTHELFFLHACL